MEKKEDVTVNLIKKIHFAVLKKERKENFMKKIVDSQLQNL